MSAHPQATSVVPASSDAIVITAPGGPAVLSLQSRPTPRCGDQELLVAVEAAGVNRHDCNQRRRGPEPNVSDIPGLEMAGTVAAVGGKVTGWRPGDRVCGLTDGGSYARYVAIPAAHALPWPEDCSALEAAALPEALFTIWHNFFNVAALGAGESVLIHGGTSGVGTIAIQLLSALGHPVYVTCGTEAKCAAARQLGAAAAYNYTNDDWAGRLKAQASGGVDVVLDMAAGRYAEQNLEVLARRGRIVHLSPGQNAQFSAPLRAIMAKEAKVTGSLLRPLPEHEKTAIARQLRKVAWPLLHKQVRPLIHQVFPLAQAADAHAMMESAGYAGKLMLDCTR